MTTAQERNEQVLAVLAKADKPLTPTDIAFRIRQPWCRHQGWPQSNTISPVLKRIGAFSPSRGKWLHPDKKGGAK
jgi:hypothetical protein